ncbi:MAG: hypothetical protein P4L64_11090 [Caulobacteraceae bacterium]|nr:hypothetical protein [Caulobacteraceae bacterium]
MQRHWVRYGPPVYIAAALYLGLSKPERRARDQVSDPADLALYLESLPGVSGRRDMA